MYSNSNVLFVFSFFRTSKTFLASHFYPLAVWPLLLLFIHIPGGVGGGSSVCVCLSLKCVSMGFFFLKQIIALNNLFEFRGTYEWNVGYVIHNRLQVPSSMTGGFNNFSLSSVFSIGGLQHYTVYTWWLSGWNIHLSFEQEIPVWCPLQCEQFRQSKCCTHVMWRLHSSMRYAGCCHFQSTSLPSSTVFTHWWVCVCVCTVKLHGIMFRVALKSLPISFYLF